MDCTVLTSSCSPTPVLVVHRINKKSSSLDLKNRFLSRFPVFTVWPPSPVRFWKPCMEWLFSIIKTEIGDEIIRHLIYWNWKKKYIWWWNIPSLKIRFSDEKLLLPIIFYWWWKNFVTCHFYHFFYWWRKFRYQYIPWWSLGDECYFVTILSPYVFGDEIRTYCNERFRHHSPFLL